MVLKCNLQDGPHRSLAWPAKPSCKTWNNSDAHEGSNGQPPTLQKTSTLFNLFSKCNTTSRSSRSQKTYIGGDLALSSLLFLEVFSLQIICKQIGHITVTYGRLTPTAFFSCDIRGKQIDMDLGKLDPDTKCHGYHASAMVPLCLVTRKVSFPHWG